MLVADREVDGRGRRLADGLLAELAETMARATDGALVALRIDAATEADLELWSRLTGHSIVERVDDEGQLRVVVRKGAPLAVDDDLDVGARLWIYTNFHCNLACDYCCVRSSPKAAPRIVPVADVARRAAEARALGFQQVLLTGGEPFLRPDIAAVVHAAAEHLPVTLLTNAMLFQSGRGAAALAALPRGRVTLQVSLDSPTPALHDRHRGAGSWTAAWQGIEAARALGFRVRVAATCARQEDRDAMVRFLTDAAFPPGDQVVRPLARRGEAAGVRDAVALARRDLVPELTVTAEGVFWHPVGATDEDLRVADPDTPLADAVARVRGLLDDEAKTGERLMSVFHCA